MAILLATFCLQGLTQSKLKGTFFCVSFSSLESLKAAG